MDIPKSIVKRDELTALIKKAQAAFEALTPEQQAAYRRAQRKSWVVGEMMLEHENMTREQAEELYNQMCIEQGYIP